MPAPSKKLNPNASRTAANDQLQRQRQQEQQQQEQQELAQNLPPALLEDTQEIPTDFANSVLRFSAIPQETMTRSQVSGSNASTVSVFNGRDSSMEQHLRKVKIELTEEVVAMVEAYETAAKVMAKQKKRTDTNFTLRQEAAIQFEKVVKRLVYWMAEAETASRNDFTADIEDEKAKRLQWLDSLKEELKKFKYLHKFDPTANTVDRHGAPGQKEEEYRCKQLAKLYPEFGLPPPSGGRTGGIAGTLASMAGVMASAVASAASAASPRKQSERDLRELTQPDAILHSTPIAAEERIAQWQIENAFPQEAEEGGPVREPGVRARPEEDRGRHAEEVPEPLG